MQQTFKHIFFCNLPASSVTFLTKTCFLIDETVVGDDIFHSGIEKHTLFSIFDCHLFLFLADLAVKAARTARSSARNQKLASAPLIVN